MQTARERAETIWKELLDESYEKGDEAMIPVIERALKEQDRLTRHAIAEKLLEGVGSAKIKGEGLVDVIEASRAENIAMNTRAV